MFCKKDVLRNFAKFTGKHLHQSLFLNKVAGLKPVTLLKERLWHRSFPVYFAKFLRTTFLIKHLRWLLFELFLECQSIWYPNRNTIFSRMNIIFFRDARSVFFRDKGVLVCLPEGKYHISSIYTYIEKIPYFHVFFDKGHLLSFSI